MMLRVSFFMAPHRMPWHMTSRPNLHHRNKGGTRDKNGRLHRSVRRYEASSLQDG